MSASKDQPFHTISGDVPNTLANAISDAIHAAMSDGLRLDDAVCITIGVAADYARHEYGDDYLDDLNRVLLDRKGRPMPENIA